VSLTQRSNIKKCKRLIALEDLHRGDLPYSIVSTCPPDEMGRVGRIVPFMILQKMHAAEDIVVLFGFRSWLVRRLVSRAVKMTQGKLEGRSGVVHDVG
jgi:hypothetical protein